jgi:hypothetical protein
MLGCSKNLDILQPIVQPPKAALSFHANVIPIFVGHGCPSCHGGISGLTVTSVSQLLLGGNHGPTIIPGKADSSILIQKLSPLPPFGERMPFGGPYLSDADIQIIRDWINQGAKDN